jgi:formate dehydrogenase subunit gamma
MQRTIRSLGAALALLVASSVMAQGEPAAKADAAAASPTLAASAATAVEPRADETNAQRARTQPGNNAPFWRGVRDSGKAPGSVNNMAAGERGVLVQEFTAYPGTKLTTSGEAWRQIRNRWIIPYGGALLLITFLAIALYYFAKGPIRQHQPNTGRLIERFTYFERAAHWINAIAFGVLALSGLVLAFGKYILLPLIGTSLLGWLSYGLKTAHNFVGPLFAVSMLVMFFAYLRSNWPSRDDIGWLTRAGGMLGGAEPPSHRFNAGEKIVFWGGIVVLGTIVIGSGLVLDKLLPGLDYLRADMQVAHIVHAIGAVLIMALFLGHTYMGTIGIQGSYQAMKTGYVDEAWASDHHRLWYDDIRAGKIPAQRSAPHAPRRELPAA